MDFSNRGNQPQHNMPTPQPMATGSSNGNHHKSKRPWSQSLITRWVNVIMTMAVVLVLIGLLLFLVYGKGTNPQVDNEGIYVKTTNLQAVFLNTGQVYFGNITAFNNNYVVLTHIFYLQSNSSSTSTTTTPTSSSNVTLVKLGCELHAPLDQMVINRSSVTFWENLSSSGQVAQAVSRWDKANPTGEQKCTTPTTTTSTTK